MGLTSFFRRQRADSAEDTSSGASADSIAAARTRARRRLIGAVVLLGIGVIGFPLLFETQPRPIPVDIPIDIPPRDGAPALRAPPKAQVQAPAAAASRPSMREPQREAAQREAPRAAAPVVEEVAPAEPAAERPQTAQTRPAPVPPAAASTSVADASTAASTAASRFIVQVGAFAETDKAREARSKVEGLGLKTYTQVVDTAAGKRTRLRVGPYPSRDEAERAAAKLRSGGLPAAILEL